MERGAHQRRLHDALFHERAIERPGTECLEPGPQPDVGRGRPLGLEARDALHGPDDRKPLAFQQELSCQGRPIELPEREDALVAA